MPGTPRQTTIPFSDGTVTAVLEATLAAGTEIEDFEHILDDIFNCLVGRLNSAPRALSMTIRILDLSDGTVEAVQVFEMDVFGVHVYIKLSCELNKDMDADVAISTIARDVIPHVFHHTAGTLVEHADEVALAGAGYKERLQEEGLKAMFGGFLRDN